MYSNLPDGASQHFNRIDRQNELHDINYKHEMKEQKKNVVQCLKHGRRFSTQHEEMLLEKFIAREIEESEANQKRFQAAILLALKNKELDAAKEFCSLVQEVLQNFLHETVENFIEED